MLISALLCFSAVVGPNGSGKSNVIDVMVFVFGKRVQQMRLNKVSELIHDTHQNLDKASVSVHFNDIIDLVNSSILLLEFLLRVHLSSRCAYMKYSLTSNMKLPPKKISDAFHLQENDNFWDLEQAMGSRTR